VKQKAWPTYGVLIITASWLALMATGQLGGWVRRLAEGWPSPVMLTIVLAIPVLLGLCRLHLGIPWNARVALFLVLLACVSLMPVAFDTHPAVVAGVAVAFFVEEYAVIPFINKRRFVQSE